MGLSQLRHHKKRHNFADTPSDICLCNEGIENISHFFLYCPFHITHRESLTSSVNDILTSNNLTIPQDLTELYLYGHPSLSVSENKSILLATVSFIKSTNRFSLWGYLRSPSPLLTCPGSLDFYHLFCLCVAYLKFLFIIIPVSNVL